MAQRGKKPSMPQFPGDFIALGAKAGNLFVYFFLNYLGTINFEEIIKKKFRY